MIFSGQASGGTMYTDQGKQPDQTNNNYHSKSSEKNKKKSIEKKADDEPFHRQEVKIL